MVYMYICTLFIHVYVHDCVYHIGGKFGGFKFGKCRFFYIGFFLIWQYRRRAPPALSRLLYWRSYWQFSLEIANSPN